MREEKGGGRGYEGGEGRRREEGENMRWQVKKEHA